MVVIDLNKIKLKNSEKIRKMDNEKFKKRQAKIYEVLKELPSDLKNKYGIVEQMPKEQVIKIIDSLEKNKIYLMIDEIPNNFIADQFRKYLKEKGKELGNSSLVVEINKIWNSMIKKAN